MNVYSRAGGDVTVNSGVFGVHHSGRVNGSGSGGTGGELTMGNGGIIAGNLDVAAGATLRASGGTGALQVQGATRIATGVNAAMGDGAWTIGDTFALLTIQDADAHLFNHFEGQAVSYALYNGVLTRDTGITANTLYLGIVDRRNAVDHAETPNQHNTLEATDDLPPDNPIRDALLNLKTGMDVRAAGDQLSGELHPSIQVAVIDCDRAFLRILNQRLSRHDRDAAGATARGVQG